MIEIADPEWLVIADEKRGVHETPGSEATAQILEYHHVYAPGETSDEVPWCSSFLGYCIKKAGLDLGHTNRMARSWLNFGVECVPPKRGAIVVLTRGNSPSSGHVGFYLRDYKEDFIVVLGGNQGDAVTQAVFSKSRVLGYRWPKEG